MGLVEKALAHKKKFIPKDGFNLVGLDEFESPEEALYLIGHFDTRPAAEKEMAKRASSSADRMFVYGHSER